MGHAEDVALCEKHRTLVASVCYCECVSYPCACKLTVARVAEDCAAMRAERDAYRAALEALVGARRFPCDNGCGQLAPVTVDHDGNCPFCDAELPMGEESAPLRAALALLAGHKGGK